MLFACFPIVKRVAKSRLEISSGPKPYLKAQPIDVGDDLGRLIGPVGERPQMHQFLTARKPSKIVASELDPVPDFTVPQISVRLVQRLLCQHQ